jgi:hypothetical protein
MNESFAALAEVQSARAQAKVFAGKTSSSETKQRLAEFDRKAAALEGAAVPGFFGTPPSAKQPENFSTLNQRFGRVLSIADAADGAPTSQTEAVSAELQASLTEALSNWKVVKSNDLGAINGLLEKERQGRIDPARRNGDAPSADVDGDDEP